MGIARALPRSGRERAFKQGNRWKASAADTGPHCARLNDLQFAASNGVFQFSEVGEQRLDRQLHIARLGVGDAALMGGHRVRGEGQEDPHDDGGVRTLPPSLLEWYPSEGS